MNKTYENELQAAAMNTEMELSEEELNEVSGGIGILGALAIVGGGYVAGRIYGYFAGKKSGICG